MENQIVVDMESILEKDNNFQKFVSSQEDVPWQTSIVLKHIWTIDGLWSQESNVATVIQLIFGTFYEETADSKTTKQWALTD